MTLNHSVGTGDCKKYARDTMSNMLPDHEAYVDRSNEDTYGRKNKKEVILVVCDEVARKKVFHQMYTILDHHGTQSGKYSDDHTDYHD